MEIDEIHRLVQQGRYEFSFHAQQERLDEDLDVREVEEVIARSEILERYPTDPRGESCLVLGYARGRPMHAVVGWAGWKGRGGSGRIPGRGGKSDEKFRRLFVLRWGG